MVGKRLKVNHRGIEFYSKNNTWWGVVMIKNVVIYGNTRLDYSWFVKTFKEGLLLNGNMVHLIDYRTTPPARAYERMAQIKPDVCFTHLTFHNQIYPMNQVMNMFADARKNFGVKIVHVIMDAREEPRYAGDISQAFDCALLSQTKNLEKFQNYWKIPVYFFSYCSLTYNKMASPCGNLQFADPVFTGNPHAHEDRVAFLTELQHRMHIQTFVTQSKGDLRHRTPELSSSAWAILGLCTGYDIDGYIDVRPFQYMGAGAVMITRRFKGMDNVIPPDLYFPFDGYTPDDAEFVRECYKQKCYYNGNGKMREKAFKYIQQHHSSKVRLLDIMEAVNGS